MNRLWHSDEAEGKLCSFHFVDLRRTGQLSLVVVFDGGGSVLSCFELAIFDKTTGGIEVHEYRGNPGDDEVKHIVGGINRDGRFELVVRPFDMTDHQYERHNVYAWTGDGYTNVSRQYPRYYRDWLASLKKQIAEIERERLTVPLASAHVFTHTGRWHATSGSPPVAHMSTQPELGQPASSLATEVEEGTKLELDEKRAEAAKIERFLGLSKDAGILDAIRWANGENRDQRILATQALADIGTSEALSYEATLGRDADPEVAKLASRKLRSWEKDDPYYPVTFHRETPDE